MLEGGLHAVARDGVELVNKGTLRKCTSSWFWRNVHASNYQCQEMACTALPLTTVTTEEFIQYSVSGNNTNPMHTDNTYNMCDGNQNGMYRVYTCHVRHEHNTQLNITNCNKLGWSSSKTPFPILRLLNNRVHTLRMSVLLW